ncbi:hypothetical protein ACIKTA_02995 [Hansschlegelia beijingensis]|uniref:hypothetical protein n=1 Tax=Hansschlegelia beijingensis TaxID=1133344 RepID=UPI00381A86F2
MAERFLLTVAQPSASLRHALSDLLPILPKMANQALRAGGERVGGNMSDLELEAALAGILARLSDGDDPALADRAIDLLLNRFGDDQAARMAAIKRLTRDLLEAAPADDEISEIEPARVRSKA